MNDRDIKEIDNFLFDMDGTIYVSGELMPGAVELLKNLDSQGKNYIFLTNNSSKRASDYRKKLQGFGIDVEESQILTSGEATAIYLLRNTKYRRVFLIGTKSLEDEFTDAGFTLTDKDPECVVLGFDTTITFKKLETASILLARGLPYYATHPDFTCITDKGLIPDTGAFIVALESVTKRTPKIIGKPEAEMVEAALEKLNSKVENTAIVGDQLDTDMTMAKKSGLFGVLLFSGETSKERFNSQQEIKPNLALDNVGELLKLIKR